MCRLLLGYIVIRVHDSVVDEFGDGYLHCPPFRLIFTVDEQPLFCCILRNIMLFYFLFLIFQKMGNRFIDG